MEWQMMLAKGHKNYANKVRERAICLHMIFRRQASFNYVVVTHILGLQNTHTLMFITELLQRITASPVLYCKDTG